MRYKIESLAGKPYMPHNGTEGRAFEDEFCLRCKHDDWFRDTPTSEAGEPGDKNCAIWAKVILGEGQPIEWMHDFKGRPTCTAFEEYDEGDDGDDNGPIDPNQLLLFDLDRYSYGTLSDILAGEWKEEVLI